MCSVFAIVEIMYGTPLFLFLDPVLNQFFSSNNLKMVLLQNLPWSKMAIWLKFQRV